jgi:hypothetical protein
MARVAAFIFWIGILALPTVLGWQTAVYLKDDTWPSLSVIDGLKFLDLEWAYYPHVWLWPHNVLGHLNLGLGICVICMMVASILFAIDE